MKIAVFGRITEKTSYPQLETFFAFLRERKIAYAVQPAYAQELRDHLPSWDSLVGPHMLANDQELDEVDFAYSFGGDGTLLNSVRQLKGRDVPVLGVNFGRLGFLTSVMQEQLIPATEDLMRGIFRVETRSAIEVESDPPGLFGGRNFGLNDLTIHKSNTNEMITVHTYINGEFLNSYWGDGLIIATPTGSTAYSLACGGPIIHPNAGVFVITPVAPHSLTVRPIVIPDRYVISFEIESRSGQAMVALDTYTELVNQRTEIAVRRSDTPVKLVRTQGSKYLDMLRDRMMWGKDTRN
jgi:NAD+ kinase